VTTPSDPLALLRSRSYVALLGLAAIIGAPVSAAAYFFLALVSKLQGWIFTDLPKHVGFHSEPLWWPIPPLLLAGVLVSLTIRYLPGKGGHSPADGFKVGAGPASPVELPGIVLAAFATLSLGVVLGPEAPLIALGGGALATGVGHVVKARAPGVEVICIQPRGAPAMTYSWRQRRVVTTDSTSTIADGVAGRRPIPAVLDDLLLVADDAVLVQEASIIAGMRMLLDHAGLVVEPSAALGIAAILEDRDRFAGRHVLTIVCGSNVDVDAYHRWVGAAPTHRS